MCFSIVRFSLLYTYLGSGMFVFNLISINQTECSTIPECPSLIRLFTSVILVLKGLYNSSNICVLIFVNICFVYICALIDFLALA